MRSASLAFLTLVLAVTFSPFVNAQCKDRCCRNVETCVKYKYD